MFFTKKRLIHALTYEGILLLMTAVALSSVFHLPLEMTGLVGVFIALVSMLWNMLFNYFFEQIERALKWHRTVGVRILHAVGFEGGLLIFTVPFFAYVLQLSLWDALVLDIAITSCILVYTFIFQWCYDTLEIKYFIKDRFDKA